MTEPVKKMTPREERAFFRTFRPRPSVMAMAVYWALLQLGQEYRGRK